jgi:hypothetical protein
VDGGDSSPMVDQGQAQDDEHAHNDDQAQVEGQGEDQNSGDDQVASQESFEEAQARRARKVEDALHKGSHTLDSVIGGVRKWVSTRRQLANFSIHHAFVSCVEPQKVFEALEDPDWVEAMHEELNNFKRNKVWSLVEKPKDCRNVIGTKWVFKNKQDANGIIVRTRLTWLLKDTHKLKALTMGRPTLPWLASSQSISSLLILLTTILSCIKWM